MGVWTLFSALMYVLHFHSGASLLLWVIWSIIGIGYCDWKGFSVTFKWIRIVAKVAREESRP
jgi:hypothetical protein